MSEETNDDWPAFDIKSWKDIPSFIGKIANEEEAMLYTGKSNLMEAREELKKECLEGVLRMSASARTHVQRLLGNMCLDVLIMSSYGCCRRANKSWSQQQSARSIV